MNHTKMDFFPLSACCVFVSVIYIISEKNVFTLNRSIEAIKLWINKLDILMHHHKVSLLIAESVVWQ